MDTNPRRTDYIATLPATSQGIVRRAFAGDASPRQAIKAKCLTCCNCDRAEVAACAVVTCPLFEYRPRFVAGVDAAMPIPAAPDAEGSDYDEERGPAIPNPHPAAVF